MSVFRDRVFQADYVRALASDSRQEPRREVDAGQQREVVDKSRHLDSFGHGGKVPKECLFAHLPVEGRDDGTPSAPISSAWRASSMASRVPGAPTPIRREVFPFTISTTASAKLLRSSKVR